MQTLVHYFLHFGAPFIIAYVFFRSQWKKAYLILLATMLVDLDHLLATPIFQADRCSINFHLLHTHYAMIIYVVLLFFKGPLRIIGIGLLFHMVTDTVDCLFTYSNCKECLATSPAIGLLETIANLLNI